MTQYSDRPVTTPPSLNDIRASLGPVLRRGRAIKAIVFGSYARGAADEYSDLDLIVVVETTLPFFERYKEFAGVFGVWSRGLDMLIYTPAELEEMVAEERPFIELALDDGIVIYEE